jgi:hypothetical protein
MCAVRDRRGVASSAFQVGLLCLSAGFFEACAADSSDVVVGSSNFIVRHTAVSRVTKLNVHLPFDTMLANGDVGELQLQGEDNLLDQIHVSQTADSQWQIFAPLNLAFEQHQQLRVVAPFADMIQLEYQGDVHTPSDGSTRLGGGDDTTGEPGEGDVSQKESGVQAEGA